MKILSMLILSSCFLFSGVALSADNINFDGESYPNKFTNKSATINLAEYVREDETFKNWTKLIAVRNYVNLTSPKEAAVNLARAVKQQNPKSNFQILQSKEGTDVQIDFLTWPKSLEYLEFNIHRYMKVDGYDGLISYQFAYRFKISASESIQLFKKNKNHWVSEMVKAKFKIDFDG